MFINHIVKFTGATRGTERAMRTLSGTCLCLIAFIASTATAAETGLTAEYWANQQQNLSGPPTVTRIDATVDMEWGGGSPGFGIGINHFTARWSGQVQPEFSETYTFHTTTDDGVRLWVDGRLLINKWYDQGPTQWSGTIALIAGQRYQIRMEYFENLGSGVAKLAWSSASTPQQIIPQARLLPQPAEPPPAIASGLTAAYWTNQARTFSGPPTLMYIEPVVDADWGGRSPGGGISMDKFTARWTGQVQPQFSETYAFHTTTDDGVRLWIDGQLVIDRWRDQGATPWSGVIPLTAGQKYDLQMEFYESRGGASARLSWSSPSQPRQIIPQERLFPTIGGELLVEVAFEGDRSSAPESETAAPIAVVLSAASSQPVMVRYTMSGTAPRKGVDYTVGDGTLIFAPGETRKSIDLGVVNDALDEDDEEVGVTLSPPVNASRGGRTTHIATILDDDPLPTVTFGAASGTGSEAVSTVSIPVMLSAPSGRSVTIPYKVTAGTGVTSSRTGRCAASSTRSGPRDACSSRSRAGRRCSIRDSKGSFGMPARLAWPCGSSRTAPCSDRRRSTGSPPPARPPSTSASTVPGRRPTTRS